MATTVGFMDRKELFLYNLDVFVSKLLGEPLLEAFYIYLFIYFLTFDFFLYRGIEHQSSGGKAIRSKAI